MGTPSAGKAQDTNRNYVMKTVHVNADSTQAQRRAVVYYDGLGRPVQTIRRGGVSPDGNDLADRVEYDSLGREYRAWQAARSPYSNGFPVDSAVFVPTVSTFLSDAAPFTETLYDGSPLDRVRKVTGPGEAWHLAGKGVKSNYYTNAESVGTDSLHCIRFGFSLSGNTGITFTRDNLWPSGSLTVDRTEDEDGRTLWVFKDMRDLVVLERRLAEAATNSAGAVYADTYYLYDDAGRLTAVLPPELSAYFGWGNWPGISETAPKVEGFAFQYRYDARGRMIAKKLPGAAWTYYVYDKGDRLVLTQDGNQRERGEWSFRLQDALGRECLTGTMAGSYDAFADPLGSVQVRAIRNHGDGDYGSLHDYSVEGLSLPADAEALTVNWWDDYSFLGHESGMGGSLYGYTAPAATEPYSARYETSAAGLQTGHWNRTLGEVRQNVGPAVMEAWYYDDHGRVVYHVKGYPSGRRVQERSGYDFVGNLTALGRTMYDGAGVEEHTEAYAYQYDNWGRLQNTTHTLDGGTPVTLTNNTYDSVGRLNGTTRGAIGATPGPASLSSSYAYNVRDWLTEINCPLFSETLAYETPRTGSTLPGQWSGNISSSQWRTSASSSDWKWYDYAYDMMGRLTEAAYGSDVVSQNNYSRTYAYDLNGNLNERETASHSEQWTAASGNAPAAWVRTTTSPFSILQQEGYAYDAAGNRTAVLDALGDTLNVTAYNLLNLPKEYVASAGDVVKYVYSTDGEKLYVQQTTSANVSTGTEYAANYRLEDGSLTMIHTDAGYYTPVTPPSGAGNPIYEHIWYLKDHLGNNRVLADGNGNSITVNDYDPFGESIQVASSSGVNPFPLGATESPYKYGGKEWNEWTSTYDFEARYHSPGFHRFTTMDPLAEKYYSVSPYAYCADNPVNLVDPEGTSIRIRKNQTGALKSLALIAATQRGSHILTAISRRYEIGGHFEPEYILTPVSTILRARFTGREIRYVKDPILPVGNGSADEYAFMGHEIGHAYDHYNGNLRMKNGRPVAGRVSSESRSVTFENYLRSVYGNDKLRTSYSGLNSNPAFNPKTDPYYQERITNFVLLNEDEYGKRLGYSYVSTIDGISVTHFLIVGVDKDDYFYFNVYGSEEEYREASGW